MGHFGAKARKVVCIGRNYADHISELHNARPTRPFFFLKPPSSIHPSTSTKPVLRPRGVTVHHEVELALIMSRTLRDLNAADAERAMAAIRGYAVAIDLTGRNVQDEAKRKGLPWSIAKGFDTFLPMSQFIRKSALPDPYDAKLYLSVNDRMKQTASTDLMLFRIPRILSDISKVMTLEKGDVVLTGTPSGVGPVAAGDVMRAGIIVGGEEIQEGHIEVEVQDREGPYEYQET
ncbi:MAG: hypothetical protein M1817_004963 [Caeruleum heppii]|nr:MAG: hypothetical protein M1817_004963 [Caeruleum heppii]